MPEKTRPSSAKGPKSTRPGTLSYGYNSPFADDEHIVRHSLSSQEGMPVLDAAEIKKQAEALSQARDKAGVNAKYQHPFDLSPEDLERDARLESDVEANEEDED
jgi:hypothetical protein